MPSLSEINVWLERELRAFECELDYVKLKRRAETGTPENDSLELEHKELEATICGLRVLLSG
jgi:hypothetical protein